MTPSLIGPTDEQMQSLCSFVAKGRCQVQPPRNPLARHHEMDQSWYHRMLLSRVKKIRGKYKKRGGYIHTCLRRRILDSWMWTTAVAKREERWGWREQQRMSTPMTPSLISPQTNRHQVYVHLWPRGNAKSNLPGNPIDMCVRQWGEWWQGGCLCSFGCWWSSLHYLFGWTLWLVSRESTQSHGGTHR